MGPFLLVRTCKLVCYTHVFSSIRDVISVSDQHVRSGIGIRPGVAERGELSFLLLAFSSAVIHLGL